MRAIVYSEQGPSSVLRVGPDDLATDDDLSRWVEAAIIHARSRPAK
jgi:hypothetical protein